jgi:RimJ/RimL family protein N-acetyltransferase
VPRLLARFPRSRRRGRLGDSALRAHPNHRTGTLVARAGTHHPLRDDWPGVECGWTLHPDHWGKGYATEAGRAAVDYAFAVLGCDEVFSVILPTNVASQAVATRLGFTLWEERVLAFLPGVTLGIWRLPRGRWTGSG